MERLTTDAVLRQRARSLRETLEASEMAQRGVLDAYGLTRALEQDPTNQVARHLLASGDQALIDAQAARTRWLTSGAIGSAAILAILFVLLRPRSDAKGKTRDAHNSAGAGDVSDALALRSADGGKLSDAALPDAQGDHSSSADSRHDVADGTADAALDADRSTQRQHLGSVPLDGVSSSPPLSNASNDATTSVPRAPDQVAPEGQPDADLAPPKRRDPFEDL